MTPAGAALRAEAARVLVAVLDEGRSLKAVLAEVLPTILDGRDRALLEAMVFAALRFERGYDFVLRHWLARPLPNKTPKDRAVQRLLWVGLAQIDALQLSPHAAVAATVDAVKLLGREGLAGLFNAILRKATREPWPVSSEAAIATSHPDWLVAALQNDWPERWESVLSANNAEAPLWLRANAPRFTRDDLQVLWAGQGIATQRGMAAHSLRLEQRGNPAALPGFEEGRFGVQDLAAQLAVEALAPQTGARVLDACAAPGGKTVQLCAAVGDAGEVWAIDSDPRRLSRVSAVLRHLAPSGAVVQARAADAADVARWSDGQTFDAILLDAPCSATGIIRRQPDIKVHRQAADLPALVALQKRLLDALWPLLKPGGRMLYATCSVLRDENDRQVADFLARTPSAHLRVLPEVFGFDTGHGTQRFPGEGGGDGFFYALLEKRNSPA